MKNLIHKYYNLKIDKIYKSNNNHFFYINDEKIIIFLYYGEEDHLKTLFNLTNDLFLNKVLVNTFLVNNNNQFYIKRDDHYIILLKTNEVETDINWYDLEKFFYKNSTLESYNVISEWEKEIDELERNLIEYNQEFTIIQNSINYFIGLGENAIELLNNYKHHILKSNDSIGHKYDINLFEKGALFNPFYFIRVNKMYDISNYIKYKFINNTINYKEIADIIQKSTTYERIFFFSCLMYPNIFFEHVKSVLSHTKNEIELKIFLSRITEYNKLLVYCKNQMNLDIINSIMWIK